MQNQVNIKLIDTDDYINEEGYYEIDLYPNRTFDSEIFTIYAKKESFGNVHWIKMLNYYDAKNIRVNCFTTYNYLPIACQIAHKVYLEKTDIHHNFYSNNYGDKGRRLTYTGIDRVKFYATYLMDKGWGPDKPAKHKEFLNLDYDGGYYAEDYLKKPIYFDKKDYFNFMSEKDSLPKNTVITESKRKYNDAFMHTLYSHEPRIVGHDRTFQQKLTEGNAKDCFLTYQILMSMYNACAFVGIRGAASLLSMTPINLIVMTDVVIDNLCNSTFIFHNHINQYLYGVPTQFFMHASTHPDLGLAGTWRERAIVETIKKFCDLEEKIVPKINLIES